jgi:hypothetical protein
VFRVVGADPKLKSMFGYYQIMIVLLKVCPPCSPDRYSILNLFTVTARVQFDYFAFLGVTIQLLILVLKNDTAQYAVTIAAIPVVLVLLTACGIAVAREIRWCADCQSAVSRLQESF